MKTLADLDFALNRAQRSRRQQLAVAALALIFGLQLGAAAWRWQTLQGAQTALQQRQQWLQNKGAHANPAALTAEQNKLGLSAQAMLNSLAVPWDDVLQAIEAARPPRVVVDSIVPHATDGVVSISVSSPDFANVAALVQNLMRQESLYEVMLASEALPDSGGVLRAVVTAHWTPVP